MVNFIEFPIFTGVSGELRPWISELEDFFVREKFRKLEKMNLAQSLLEGEAEAWFYRIQKTLIFYSWTELKDKLLLRFGDVADSDRIRLIAEQDRFFKEIRDEERIQRLKTTSIPEKDSIWETEKEALVPADTIPVTNLTESRETTYSTLATKSIQEAISESVMDGGVSVSFEKETSCQAIEYIHAIASFSAKESIETDESHEPMMVKVEGDTTMFPILDSLEEELSTQTQVHVSKLEHSLQVHNVSPNVCENCQDVVDCDALGKEENLLSGLSQTSQVWESGGVLKLKEPVGLVNQKKSRCLKASMFNFKRRKKRIKSRHNQLTYTYASVREDWFNTLSRRESWRKHKHENLQIVSGLVGFNLGYFRCHKEYGLARMINWSQVRVECSLLQEILFCQNSLSRNMPSILVIVAQFKFKHGLETSDGIRDGDIAKLVTLTGDKLQFTSLEDVMVAFKIHHSLRNTRFQSREMKQLVGFMKFQLKHKWRSKHLHTISALECYISSVFPTVTSANSCRGCQRMNEQLQVHTILIVNNVKSQVKTKWGLVWRIWRLHNLWLVLVQFSVTPKLLEEEVLGPEIVVDVRYDDMMRCLAFGVCSGIKRPIDSRRASRVWERGGLDIRPDNFELCVGHDFVCFFYLAFKLEDKLVFQEESIDTILNRI